VDFSLKSASVADQRHDPMTSTYVQRWTESDVLAGGDVNARNTPNYTVSPPTYGHVPGNECQTAASAVAATTAAYGANSPDKVQGGDVSPPPLTPIRPSPPCHQLPVPVTSPPQPAARHIDHGDVIAALRGVIAASRSRLMARASSSVAPPIRAGGVAGSGASCRNAIAAAAVRRRRYNIRYNIRRPGPDNDDGAASAAGRGGAGVGGRGRGGGASGRHLPQGVTTARSPTTRLMCRSRGVAPLSLRQFFENGGRDYDEYLSKIEKQRQHEQEQEQEQQIDSSTTVDATSPDSCQPPSSSADVSSADCFHSTVPLPIFVSQYDCNPFPLSSPYGNRGTTTTSRDDVMTSSAIPEARRSSFPVAPMSVQVMDESSTTTYHGQSSFIASPPPRETLHVLHNDVQGDTYRTSHCQTMTIIEDSGGARYSSVSGSRSIWSPEPGVLDLSWKTTHLSQQSHENTHAHAYSDGRSHVGVTSNVGVAASQEEGLRGDRRTTSRLADLSPPAHLSPPTMPEPPQACGGTTGCSDVRSWTVDEVARFVQLVPGCTEYADTFRREKIDGVAFAHLSDDHLLKVLKMRLGPALRLRIAIDAVRGGGAGALPTAVAANRTVGKTTASDHSHLHRGGRRLHEDMQNCQFAVK
jgi:hypothetical protein